MNIGSNMTLSGSVSVGSFNLNGYDVTISALAPVIAGGLGNGTLICEGNLTINSTLTVNKGALICNGNLTIGSGNLSLGDGKADIHGNLTFGETGSLGMSSMGMTIVRGDIVSNRISNLNISAGHLYLNGDLTLTQPYRFSVPNLHISGGTNITYPSGGSVRFSKIIDPGLSRHSMIYTDGITGRHLDCTRISGQCNNSGCTFEQCYYDHEFPAELDCGAWLSCDSANCNFLSTGRTCSLCVKCKICTPCENSKIFVNAYTSLNTAIRVEINNKPTNGQLPIGTPWTLTASVIPGNVNQTVTWTSSGNSVATIDANTGLITPISRGTITITARSTINSSAVATYILTVVDAVPTGVEIYNTPPHNTMAIGGGTWTVSAKVLPAGANQSISWVSTNPTTATINAQGVINAHALGTTVIVASAKNGVSATFKLTVVSKIHFAEVNNYFDKGYVNRYGGIYYAQNQIEDVQNLINSIMSERFDLIITSNTPELYTSPADDCTSIAYIDYQCWHLAAGQECNINTSTYHCKNVRNINNNYPPGASTTDTSKIATWTGHVTCTCKEGSVCTGQNHTVFNRGGIAESTGGKRYTIAYENWMMNMTQGLRFEIALHEMSHVFGAVGDTFHDCIAGYGLVGTGEIYNMVVRGDTNIYCDICTEQIEAYLLANY